jgi:hypothetical protein
MDGLKSVVYPATTNYTNLNRISDCIFNCGSSDNAHYMLRIESGVNWLITKTDFSNGGAAVYLNDVSQAQFDHCWFEANTVTLSLIVLTGSAATRARFTSCEYTNNTCNRIWQTSSTVPTKLDISDCLIGKNAGSYCIYDNATTLRTLDAAGNIRFYDNTVTGDTVSDKCATGTEFRGGMTSPRFTASVNTASSGTLYACSDPGATITRNSTGDLTITPSHPLGSADTKVIAIATGRATDAIRAVAVSTTAVQIQCLTDAGVATDAIFGIAVYGS